jgi:hypothetical protein
MAKGKPFGRQFVPDHEWQLSARSGPPPRVDPAAFRHIDPRIFISSVRRAGLLPPSKEHAIVIFAMTIEVNQGV